MDLGVTDRVFVVTGGSRGLGRATAEVLVAEAEGQRIAGATADAMEGGMAFLQKRKAEFKGQ